jgi:hypothetical protein
VMLRAENPIVATYARAEAVDVRISARGASNESAFTLVDEAAARVVELLGDHIWAEGETTWSDAIGAELGRHGWTLACVEVGSGGSFSSLLGDRDWLRIAESLAPDAPAASGHADAETDGADGSDGDLPAGPTDGLEALARRAVQIGGAEVGVGIRVRERGADTAVTVVVISPVRVHRERRLAFLGGPAGRSRAALVAAAAVLFELRRVAPPARAETQPEGHPQVASAQRGRA